MIDGQRESLRDSGRGLDDDIVPAASHENLAVEVSQRFLFWMLGAFTSGVLLWMIYGVSIGSLPIIATLALTTSLVGMKIKLS